MKHIGNTLYQIIEEKHLVKRQIALNIGLTPEYFSQIMRKETLDARLLETICKEIKISPMTFFEDCDFNVPAQIGAINATAQKSTQTISIQQNVHQMSESIKEKDLLIKQLINTNSQQMSMIQTLLAGQNRDNQSKK